MQKIRKSLFFGYHKKTVDEIITNLTKKQNLLVEQVDKQQKLIDELTTQLTIQKNKENLISDVLLESKRTASETLATAKEQAESSIKVMYQQLGQNVSAVQEKMDTLEVLSHQLVEFEHKMKAELKKAITNQLNNLDNMDLKAYEKAKKGTREIIMQSQLLIDSAKKIIAFEPEEKEPVEEVPTFVVNQTKE